MLSLKEDLSCTYSNLLINDTQSKFGCFANKSIWILGDSRSRQVYLSLIGAFTGYENFTVVDESNHEDHKTVIPLGEDSNGYKSDVEIKYFWCNHFKHKIIWRVHQWILGSLKNFNDERIPSALIFGSMILQFV